MYLEMIGAKQVVRESAPRYITENEKYLMSLQEVYYGKTKEIKDIEKKIGECREKYRTNPMKLNTAKEREELEELFCKAFGFECCQFTIDPSGLYNACTIPVSSVTFDFRDMRKHIVSKNGQGMKYTPDSHLYLWIRCTKGLFYSTNFTDAEVTAFLLHEVGHNFQDAIDGKMRTLTTIRKIFNCFDILSTLIMQPVASPLRNRYIDFIQRLRKEAPDMVDAYWAIQNIIKTIVGAGLTVVLTISNILDMFNPIAILKGLHKELLINLGLSILNGTILPLDYRNEAIADQFAANYGYGAELSTAFEKCKNLEGGLVSNQITREIFGSYFDIITLPGTVCAYVFDPHPMTIARLNNQLQNGKKDLLNKSTNPKMKAELKKQLDEIQKSMDRMTDSEQRGFFATNTFAKGLLLAFGGDMRNIFAKGIQDDFDIANDRAEDQYKQIISKK